MLKAKRGKYIANNLMTKVQILNEIKEGTLSRKEIAENLKKSTLDTYIKYEATIGTAFEKEHFTNLRK